MNDTMAMKNPYVRIIGKRAKRKPDLKELKKLKRTAELTALFWVMEQTPDIEGNIAVWKHQIDNLKLKDDFTEFAGIYEIDEEKEIIYFIPQEITENYFKVILSEEIYYLTEGEVYEQLERMKDLDIYKDYVEVIVKIVMNEIRQRNLYPNGKIAVRRLKEITKDLDTFYNVYWKCRTTCCGSRCSSCQIFEFPDYSVRAIEKFYKKYKERYDKWAVPDVKVIYEG